MGLAVLSRETRPSLRQLREKPSNDELRSSFEFGERLAPRIHGLVPRIRRQHRCPCTQARFFDNRFHSQSEHTELVEKYLYRFHPFKQFSMSTRRLLPVE